MLITDSYRAINARMHAKRPSYGSHGHKWAGYVRQLAEKSGSRSILDYGCGKGSLAAALDDFDILEYDPAIPGKDSEPEPADIVVCTDVMEHVEAQCVDAVLSHAVGMAKHVALFSISCVQGDRMLPDGRYAHITVHSPEWWASKLRQFGKVTAIPSEPEDFNALVLIDT